MPGRVPWVECRSLPAPPAGLSEEASHGESHRARARPSSTRGERTTGEEREQTREPIGSRTPGNRGRVGGFLFRLRLANPVSIEEERPFIQPEHHASRVNATLRGRFVRFGLQVQERGPSAPRRGQSPGAPCESSPEPHRWPTKPPRRRRSRWRATRPPPTGGDCARPTRARPRHTSQPGSLPARCLASYLQYDQQPSRWQTSLAQCPYHPVLAFRVVGDPPAAGRLHSTGITPPQHCRVGGGAPRGRWPPSAAQTVRAVFPHTAFTKTSSRDEDRWRNQRVDPPPARRVQPVGKSPRSLMLGYFTHGTVHLSALAHLTVLSGPDRLRRPPSPTHSVAAP